MDAHRTAARLRLLAASSLLLLVACGGGSRPAGTGLATDASPPVPARKPANVMSHESAAWLEREGRDQLERPDLVLAAMDLQPGMTVAEIGAGTGYFSRRIAPVVAPPGGPAGKVLAVDIQPEMLDLLRDYATREGVAHIEPVLGTETDPKLPVGGVDRILLVDVYHEFQQPEPMLAHIRESLAPGGMVILVEYRAEGDTASHINEAHRMSVEQVLGEWQPAGFTLLDTIETLPSQHLFKFSAKRGARPGR
jgi:predicted methyltransferase